MPIFQDFLTSTESLGLGDPQGLSPFFALTGLWVVWRIWKFVISPQVFSSDPKPLPYWIPYFGSAIGFFRNSHDLINKAISKHESREPFTVTVVGQEFYVVTDPQNVAEVYKNTTQLSFDLFLREILVACGTSKRALEAMCSEPPPYREDQTATDANPFGKSLIRLAMDFHHIQLLPGPKSQAAGLSSVIMDNISRLQDWERLYNDPLLPVRKTPKEMDVSLLKWCGNILVEAGTKAYYGRRMWESEPDLLRVFYQFDHSAWKLFFHCPDMFSQDVLSARNHMAKVFTRHFERPKEERSDESWFTNALETEQRKARLNEYEMATTNIFIYFAINGNTYKLCFWMLVYIVSDPALLAKLRAEIDPDGTGRDPRLEHLTSACPLLDAMLHETLRLYTNSATMRHVTADTVIGGKTMRRGRQIMIPYRQLHDNGDVFGVDTASFNPNRFLEAKGLKRSSSFRPFGGGATFCAGRFVAQKEVMMFIGIALMRFDVEVPKTPGGLAQEIPRVDGGKPTLGMMAPLLSDEYIVRIKQRRMEGTQS
ncbi:cytochrome P450 oxidoreductase [Apiospora arundinis]|uniref:Cytochrome P450 oxidoreductase n=1 Tax=Apiospora arundinis TaxID=335852 RepID=A0ABR2HQ41_9PEZI